MKKTLFIITCAFLSHYNLNAQVPVDSAFYANNIRLTCLHPGNSLVDAYYGFPNMFALIFKTVFINGQSKDISATSVGPMGGKYEYLLTDEIGLGAEFNYSSFALIFSRSGVNSYNKPVIYHDVYTSPAYRVLLGVNYHFINSNNLDIYIAGKIGYYHRDIIVTSDDPKFIPVSVNIPSNPVAVRMELGLRYFPISFLGVHANFGFFGGPLVAGGVSVKF